MANNIEHVTEQVIEVTEFKKADTCDCRQSIKHKYIAPMLTRLNETNIHGGAQVYVNASSNGGAFTDAS